MKISQSGSRTQHHGIIKANILHRGLNSTRFLKQAQQKTHADTSVCKGHRLSSLMFCRKEKGRNPLNLPVFFFLIDCK